MVALIPIVSGGDYLQSQVPPDLQSAGMRISTREFQPGMLPVVHQILGSLLIVSGAIVLPLPIPLGLIMITIGFALIAPYIPVVQRLVRTMRGKWPDLDRSLRRYRDRFPPVIRKTIDKTHPSAPAE